MADPQFVIRLEQIGYTEAQTARLLGITQAKMKANRIAKRITPNRAGAYDISEILRFRDWLNADLEADRKTVTLFAKDGGENVCKPAGRQDIPMGEGGTRTEGAEGRQGSHAGGSGEEGTVDSGSCQAAIPSTF